MKTYQFEVAGIKFRAAAFNAAQVMRGDRLALKAETSNNYDLWAIAVYKGDAHIGYVPKTHNKLIHSAVTGITLIGPAARPAPWPPDRYGCCVDAVWKTGCWVVVNIKEDKEQPDESPDAVTGAGDK